MTAATPSSGQLITDTPPCSQPSTARSCSARRSLETRRNVTTAPAKDVSTTPASRTVRTVVRPRGTRGWRAWALLEERRVNELRVRRGGLTDARTRPVDEVRIDREDAVGLDRGDDRPALSRRDVAGFGGVRVRRENDDLGIA